MNKHRTLKLAGAGTALAACLALAAVTFSPFGHRVEATEILASFRTALGGAFQLTFSGLEDAGLRADGRVVVVYEEPAAAAPDTNRAVTATFVEGDLSFAPDNNLDAPPMDVRFAIAKRQDTGWAYLKTTAQNAEAVADHPVAGPLHQQASSGILVDLGPLMSGMVFPGLPNAGDATGGVGISMGGAPTTSGSSVSISISAYRAGDAQAQPPGVTLPATDGTLLAAGIGGPSGAVSIQVDDSEADSEAIARLITRFLQGEATQADVEALVSHIEVHAENVSVEHEGEGLHILTASGFETEPEGDGTATADSVLRIAYREGAGVEWATITDIGPLHGEVRFEHADITADDPMFSDQRYRDMEGTRVTDLMSLFMQTPLLPLIMGGM